MQVHTPPTFIMTEKHMAKPRTHHIPPLTDAALSHLDLSEARKVLEDALDALKNAESCETGRDASENAAEALLALDSVGALIAAAFESAKNDAAS